MNAIITGAGRGIGKEIAIALASKGIHTILISRTPVEINAVAQEISSKGGKATPIACDVSSSRAVTALVGKTVRLGKIGLIVNNAGVAPSVKIEGTSDQIWQNAFATNVDATFYLTRAYLPDMKALGEGQIINIASTAAIEGFPYTAAYTASKHALLGLSRALAKELEPLKIKISTICPGFVRTGILERSIANIVKKTERTAKQAEADLAKMNKSGKIIEPEEVAKAVVAELKKPLDPNGREIIL
jgi:3-hydroxybutyrate dehydrogenase